MTPYDDELIMDLDIPNWRPRASLSQRSQRHTEAKPPFKDTQEPSQTESLKDTRTQSWVGTAIMRLKLVVGFIMVIFSLCTLVIIWLLWPTIVSATSSVASCDPPYVTSGCPHLEPMRNR